MGAERTYYRTEAQEMEMEEIDYGDTELVKYVKDTLQSVFDIENDRNKGNYDELAIKTKENYDKLVEVINHKERLDSDDVARLVTSLKALTAAASHIYVGHHSSLIEAIFTMNMWNYGSDVVDAIVDLIKSLARNGFLELSLNMLVSNFTPPVYLLEFLKQPRGLAKKQHVLSRIHSALENIYVFIPLAPMTLKWIVVQNMPSNFKKDYLIVMYVENMLRLENSCSMRAVVQSTLLNAVVDRLIELDVQIPWEEIIQDDWGKSIFAMELEARDDAIDYDVDNDEEFPRTSSQKYLSGNVIAELLDSLMVVAFEHLESCDHFNRLDEVFEVLLKSFQLTVLNTQKSKFAQFVMFYACSLKPDKCGVMFAETLRDLFLGSYPPLTRMSAVAYLASYLARAKFISSSTVISMLKSLADWCSKYCQMHKGVTSPEANRFFYAACQAIMYVLCFRMKSMIDVPRLKSELLLMPIESILKHQLNPLEVCLPAVVEEFLRQAKAAHLLCTVSDTFIFEDLLESENSKAFGGPERLDMFFPFDPCLLKKCDKFIRPSFVYWSMVKTTYHDDATDSSDEDDNDDEFKGHELDSALDKMSITPKNYGMRLMPSRIRPSMSP